MTDARFPERWLNNRRIMGLDGDAFKLWIVALAWCAANRTDGVLTDDDLGQLPHSVDITRMEALWGADLMERDREAGRWVVIDYADTQLTRAELEALDEKRVKARVKKARQRAAAGTVPGDVPGDCTGQDRTGQDRTTSPPPTDEDEAIEHPF